MPYVQRAKGGKVIGRYACLQAGYAEEWLDDGHPDLAVQAPIPAAVTMRQTRLALLQSGLLGRVNAAIAAMPGTEGEAARIEWEYAQEVRRDSALMAPLAAKLGLTGPQIDDLFALAATL